MKEMQVTNSYKERADFELSANGVYASDSGDLSGGERAPTLNAAYATAAATAAICCSSSAPITPPLAVYSSPQFDSMTRFL